MSAAVRGARPQRTLVQKLAPIVLGFEALVVFLAGLTVFGLKALPEGIPHWWGIVGGAVMALACIIIAGLAAKPGAIAAGWVIQVIVALAAFLVPAILAIVVVFGGMWAYATIMGAKLDARRPAQPETDSSTESE